MSRKSPGHLRGTINRADFQSLTSELTKQSVHAPVVPGPTAPPREAISIKDLVRQPGTPRNANAEFNQGPGVQEVHGPGSETMHDYSRGPVTLPGRHLYANSPAPAVSSSAPTSFTEARTGRVGVYIPRGAPLPQGAQPQGKGPVAE